MPISATGTLTSKPSRSRHASAGFSLLELLVVVVIIGIVAGAIVLSTDIVGRDREAEREAQRLRSLIELLREEALMQTRDYGVLFSRRGYRFYIYDYQQSMWIEPAEDRLLAARELPERLELSLALEDRDAVLAPTLELDEREEPEPQIMILSSGEVTPFEATVSREFVEGRYVLAAELDGTIDITEEGFARR
jgi:general secretion pathway protein H